MRRHTHPSLQEHVVCKSLGTSPNCRPRHLASEPALLPLTSLPFRPTCTPLLQQCRNGRCGCTSSSTTSTTFQSWPATASTGWRTSRTAKLPFKASDMAGAAWAVLSADSTATATQTHLHPRVTTNLSGLREQTNLRVRWSPDDTGHSRCEARNTFVEPSLAEPFATTPARARPRPLV